ncbi:SH3 type 3 domain protein [Candidatus Accumulibacter phosphatis]|uniref:SH3 type 3 domain protein n=1 Tax=Accumulibacter regalis TaxID=522306 RepID=C7RKJ2_ACCRE
MPAAAPPAADFKKPATPSAAAGQAEHGKNPAAAASKPGERQADAGKQARQGPAGAPPATAKAGAAVPASGNQQRFDRMAVRAKLAVSEPGDAVEREADAVAERVMRMQESVAAPAAARGAAPAKPAEIKRKEDPRARDPAQGAAASAPGTGAAAAKVQTGAGGQIAPGSKPEKAAGPGVAPSLQPPANGPAGRQEAAPISRAVAQQEPQTTGSTPPAEETGGAEPVRGADVGSSIKDQRGQGEPLSEDVRARMEGQLGHDFSQVRIHQDSRAHQLCRHLGALAFTTGNDIFFARGRYQPNSKAGLALLAHELAHVVQHQDCGPVIARKIDPEIEDKYKPRNQTATDAALKALDQLDIPAVKARHLPLYQGNASSGNLKRKRGYSRGNPAQVGVWNSGITISEATIRQKLKDRGLKNVPDDAGESFKLQLGNKKKPQSKSIAQLQKLLKIPTWTRHGMPVTNGFQVDHIVELQVSGENGTGTGNSLGNMELLDQPSNSSSGGAIRGAIYSKVDAYLNSFKAPQPKRKTFLKQHDLVFGGVGAKLKSGASAADSAWWNLTEIKEAKPLETAEATPDVDEEGTDKEFLLADAPGGIIIQRISHKSGPGSFAISGTAQSAISGLTLKTINITEAAKQGSGNVGSIDATWKLPKKWSHAKPDVALTLSGDGKYRGYPAKLGKQSLHFENLSPVEFDDIQIDDGKILGEGKLTPSLPLLNAPIMVRLDGDDIEFYIEFSSDQINLSAPGVTVDEATVQAAYSVAQGFKLGGEIFFTITNVADGSLKATFAQGSGLSVEGKVDFQSELFDKATIAASWSEKEKFGARGELEISKPGKIKGIKAAKLTVGYTQQSQTFTASGNAETDIPGVKNFTADARFQDAENFSITGKAELEKLPGIKSGNLDMTLAKAKGAWSLEGKASAVPDLPKGLSGSFEGSYKDGLVDLNGKLGYEDSKVFSGSEISVGVTNGGASDDGKPLAKGGGKTYVVYGSGKLKAKLTDTITGEANIRLDKSGSVWISGTITKAEAKLFERFPKEEDSRKTLFEMTSPKIPVPGLAISVGSVAVGLNLSLKGGLYSDAWVGPGGFKNISIGVKEFNPAETTIDKLKLFGDAKFEVPAYAGLAADLDARLTLDAGIASVGGSVGVEGKAGIAPKIEASPKFSWSYDDGLDVESAVTASLTPVLSLGINGKLFAEANLMVKTITLWEKKFDGRKFTLDPKLSLSATISAGYNTSAGKVRFGRPEFKTPDINVSELMGNIMGKGDERVETHYDEELGICRRRESGATSLAGAADANPNGVPAPRDAIAAPGMRSAAPNPHATAQQLDRAQLLEQIGEGVPLPDRIRNDFEQAMGVDLSPVRIHTNPGAFDTARSLQARAFAFDIHIVFAAGEFQPHRPEGKSLLAHELTHVLQSRDGLTDIARAVDPESSTTHEGREPIAHELAHVAQQQGGGDPIVLRWPAVTRTPAQTSETPASIRAMTLSGFSMLTESQLDWATSPALQADAAALAAFRDLDRFAERPNVLAGAGDLNVGDIITKGIPAIYAPLEKYAEGAATDHTAWLRSTSNINEAESWGRDLTTLEAAWPAANLSLVMRAPPNPAASKGPFEKLVDPAAPELTNFVSYLTSCTPVLSANDGSEVDSFLDLRREGALPHTYHGRINYARTYHHFTKGTLDGLVGNEAWPPVAQWSWSPLRRPLTVVLYPAVDDNGAFHRNLGLQAMVTSSDILTIVIEGHATVGGYQSQLAPVAARYGINGQIHQALIGGHGNSTVLNLAGSAGAAMTVDALGTSGATGANTTALMTALTGLMSGNPAQRRIVLDACLTNSHAVGTALRALPADAAADVNTAIGADPSLRDVVATAAGPGATVLGADASFAPSQTTFLTPGSTDIGLSVPGDPDLVADKLVYVEFGTEPTGCLRAVLECWARDQIAGTHACRDAMLRRIGAGRSTHVAAAATDTWRESVIQPLYDLAANHYWGSGEAIRQLGELADRIFVLYMENHSSAAQIDNALAVIAGNVAHVNQVFGRVTADPTSTGNMRVAITLEQVWMQYNHARRGQFMTELARYGSCALASPHVDMSLVMPQLADLLLLPPVAAQLKVALLAARHAPVSSPPPSPLPAHIAYLRGLLGAGPTFPAAAGIDAALGPLGSEEDILAAIGRPLAGAPDPTRPPNANINLGRADVPDQNEFAVTPLRRNGVVATVRDDLMVRSRPTTATNANIFARLPGGTRVQVIGEFQTWYVIEQPGSTGFVAKRYITLLP